MNKCLTKCNKRFKALFIILNQHSNAYWADHGALSVVWFEPDGQEGEPHSDSC